MRAGLKNVKKQERETMIISVLTIMPDLFDSFLQAPVIARAIRNRVLEVEVVDIRDYAPGSFRHIDDSPFGGGAGMVMRLMHCVPVKIKSARITLTISEKPAGYHKARTVPVPGLREVPAQSFSALPASLTPRKKLMIFPIQNT